MLISFSVELKQLLCSFSEEINHGWLVIRKSNYYLFLQILLWEESPSILIQGNSNKTALKYPAITICSKVSTKYGIAERLGNYIDPAQLPNELLTLKEGIFKLLFDEPLEIAKKYDNAMDSLSQCQTSFMPDGNVDIFCSGM